MLDLEIARKYFTYDAKTGEVFWRRNSLNGRGKIGCPAGNYSKKLKRYRLSLNGKYFFRYQIVWLLHYGIWPVHEIDHEDRIPFHDWPGNLRKATRSQQLSNRTTMGHNTSGYRGIYFDPRKQRWAARISVNGNRRRLGTYETKQEAFAAVEKAGIAGYREFWHAPIPSKWAYLLD
jgi:hypothetical protein